MNGERKRPGQQTWIKPGCERRTVVVSASLEILTSVLAEDETIEAVEFEAVSKLRRIEDMAFVKYRRLQSLCVPASVESIGSFCFSHPLLEASELSTLTFEGGSNLRRLEDSALFGCPHLTSLCIPASVESIGQTCFHVFESSESENASEFGLKTVSFEAGSKLKRIESRAFASCRGLRSICLPASVRAIDGTTFWESNFTKIEVEAGNTHFSVHDCFLLDFSRILIVFYFGADEEIQIPDEIETIGIAAFFSKHFIRSVSFGPGSKIRRFGDRSFGQCKTMNVLHIPSTVREIGNATFSNCKGLTCVTFESVSELVRIGEQAFYHCLNLESLCIPASVESIGKLCFAECTALSSLVFESPSHLRELRSLSGCTKIDSLDIPDSVEVLETELDPDSHVLTLNFGEGSKLAEMTLRFPDVPWGSSCVVRAFVRVPAHRLKVFRCNHEFPRPIPISTLFSGSRDWIERTFSL
jgi:hypothetical protein